MQPEVDLWCPGAVASAIQLAVDGGLFRATVTVTVRLELDGDTPQLVETRYLQNVLHVSMDELTSWPVSSEVLKRSDGVRVELPRVDARLRVHRISGAREPIQDLPFDVETLAIDRDKRLADAGLRAQFTISDPSARLIGLVGVALGKGSIAWPSRDQVVAERALSGSHLYATLPHQAAATKEALERPLPKPSTPKRRPTRPPAPARPLPKPQLPPRPKAETVTQAREPEAITLDPEDAVTLDDADSTADDSDRTQAIRPEERAPRARAVSSGTVTDLAGTVMITGGDRPPPSQRMSLSVDNRTHLAAWTVPWALMGKHSLTVVVKATCDIAGDGSPAAVRSTTDAPRGDDFHSGDPAGTLVYPSDHALLKHRADVVLVGRAYAPSGRSSRSTVTFRFGGGANAFERQIAIAGAREWTGGVPSPPQLFRSVPLIYERAFGGPGFARNPVGVGFGESERGRFVPSLEDPASLIERRGDKRRPCCPAPLSPTWEQRWKRVGKTWRSLLEEKWDALPDDFNWEFFQCAPRAQQLDYLAGNEGFEVRGVRPDDAPLRGQLPGIRPNCSVTSQAGARPVPLNLDTVLIDAEAMALHMVWRGLLSVSAPQAPELSALHVTL